MVFKVQYTEQKIFSDPWLDQTGVAEAVTGVEDPTRKPATVTSAVRVHGQPMVLTIWVLYL